MKMGAREETQGASRWGAKGGLPPQDGLQGIRYFQNVAGVKREQGFLQGSQLFLRRGTPASTTWAFARDH